MMIALSCHGVADAAPGELVREHGGRAQHTGAHRVAQRDKTQDLDACQRRNALASWRGVLSLVSPPIGQALPIRALDRQGGAARIGMPQLSAGVVAELKFVEVTL
jgi:hypothetical protein